MMLLKLYTQDKCPHCTTMIQKLAEWGLAFDVINITNKPYEKLWLKEQGVRTVPALFIDDFQINEHIDTREFTEGQFYDRLDVLIEQRSSEDLRELIVNSDAT